MSAALTLNFNDRQIPIGKTLTSKINNKGKLYPFLLVLCQYQKGETTYFRLRDGKRFYRKLAHKKTSEQKRVQFYKGDKEAKLTRYFHYVALPDKLRYEFSDREVSVTEKDAYLRALIEVKKKNGQALYDLANHYMNGEGTKKSDRLCFLCTETAAKLGFAQSQNNLGAFYEEGRNFLNQSLETAHRWYKKASQQNCKEAFFNLARYYAIKGKKKESDEAFKRGAELGHSKSQLQYAKILEQEGEFQKAKEFYFRALDGGEITAAPLLGRLFRRNNSESAACQYFQKGAEAEDPDCLYELGCSPLMEEQQALDYLNRAAEKRHLKALVKLLEIHDGDDEKLRELFSVIVSKAEEGDLDAQLETARCYRIGIGVSTSEKKTFEWYLSSAEGGNLEARLELVEGLLKRKDHDKRAVELLQMALHKESGRAHGIMGYCFHMGRGVAVEDRSRALGHYRLGMQEGDAAAANGYAVLLCSAKKYQEAFKIFKKFKNVNSDALYNYTFSLQNSKEAAQFKEEIWNGYIKAAEAGVKKAQEKLSRLYQQEGQFRLSGLYLFQSEDLPQYDNQNDDFSYTFFLR